MEPDAIRRADRRWKDALIADKDDTLVSAGRRWLGPLRTPFNKHELLARLEVYLKRPDVHAGILRLLDRKDRQILALLKETGPLPATMLESIAGAGKSMSARARLKDLRERMLIFEYREPTVGPGMWYAVTPALEDPLFAALSRADLVPSLATGSETEGRDPLAGFCALVSALAQAKPAFKSRDALSKAALTMLSSSAPWLLGDDEPWRDCLEKLFAAGAAGWDPSGRPCVSPIAFLELARALGDGMSAFLVAASTSALKAEHAAALTAVMRLLPRGARLTRRDFIALASALLIGGQAPRDAAEFAELQAAPASLLSAALRFGALVPLDGEGGDGPEGYVALTRGAERLRAAPAAALGTGLVVEESQELRLLPEAGSYERALVSSVARLESTGMVWTARLDKASACAAFAWGFYGEEVERWLEEASGKALPQSIRFSLASWERSSRGAVLRAGIVLSLDGHYSSLLESSPRASGLVREKLREGVYLLDASDIKEAEKMLNSIGISADVRSGGVAAGKQDYSGLSRDYRALGAGAGNGEFAALLARTEENAILLGQRSQAIASVEERIAAMDMAPEARAALLDRARAGYVLDAEQLLKGDWAQEQASAGGLDYPAKLRLLERAVREGRPVELALGGEGVFRGLRAWPLSLLKGPEGLALRAEAAAGGELDIAVRTISRVRLIQTDIYGE